MKKLFIISILGLLILLSSCKSDYSKESNGDTPPQTSDTPPPVTEPGSEVNLSDSPALVNRKIIYKVNLGIVSTSPSETYNEVIENLTTYDAYVESEEITSSLYKMTIRVKSINLTTMVNAIQQSGNTLNYTKTSEDITNTYSTFAARFSALETQHARILELIEVAETLNDILVLEAKRVTIEAELNEIGFKLNNFDSLIEYSTLYLTISKIENISELLPKTTTPNVSEDIIEKDSISLSLFNSSDKPTTMTIIIMQNGIQIKELTKNLYQNSQETIEIDGLKPGKKYRVEVFSQSPSHSISVPRIIEVETTSTYLSKISDGFTGSLNALISFLQFIGIAVVVILPFALVFTIIGIPLRILYIKKVRKNNP